MPTEEEAESTEGLSIASLKEAALSVYLEQTSLITAVKEIKEHSKTVKKRFPGKKEEAMGLGGSTTSNKPMKSVEKIIDDIKKGLS